MSRTLILCSCCPQGQHVKCQHVVPGMGGGFPCDREPLPHYRLCQKHAPPRTTANMAAELRNDATGDTRTLALPPGLTYAEAVAFVQPYLGTGERYADTIRYDL